MNPEKRKAIKRSIEGCLLGTAVGDAMGLPWEGLSPRRQKRMAPQLDGPSFFKGKGMFSDDTEHTCMVVQALLASQGHPENFLKNFSWRLRFWLLALPAGVGFATLRSILKLWMAVSPERSGVYSAGNGPAMRSPILGVAYADDFPRWQTLVRLSTRVTHRDPKAEVGAVAVALAASISARDDFSIDGFCQTMEELLVGGEAEFQTLIERAGESARRGESPGEFSRSLGLQKGVTGYMYHTVPVVLQAWFRYPEEFEEGIIELIRCGGDTDTMAAIYGAIVGARVGKEGIPKKWLDRVDDWPYSLRWIEKLAKKLTLMVADEKPVSPLPVPFWGFPLRNLYFTTLVLAHGFRRLLPPY